MSVGIPNILRIISMGVPDILGYMVRGAKNRGSQISCDSGTPIERLYRRPPGHCHSSQATICRSAGYQLPDAPGHSL